ncbi:putative 4-hydroxy-4-methyl-2-oxoglutarate aldolase [Paraferrimonas sp. SM1919]|uniref:putative 4-hydroxy-4-methyl-2-oxoglutarate aldolase n=1 Tax=Paraferrimonas sp. SM1919 TaxID=2662263 RepID=UPI0013D28A69|nr:putative 4-hydroxy-4-methyl-2-oxoglutarate aldolase [Paraferrimonas sp. SM1919]
MLDLTPDLCDLYADKLQLLPLPFNSYGGKRVFYGEVVTVQCFHDNSMVRQVLAQDGTGKVLFIDGHGLCDKALLGDQLAILAMQNNWQGIIVHGAIRDAGAISNMDIGVQALGTCPFKTEKKGLGQINATVNIGQNQIKPGQSIYADVNAVLTSETPLDVDKLTAN